MQILKISGLIVVVLLTACSNVQPIQQDQPILLAKGNGLAAVVMNTEDPLTEVFVKPAASGGTTMEIPSVPVGRTIYLFEVKAGNYCLQQFHFGQIEFFGQGADVECFVVPEGQLGYSGDLMPRVNNRQVFIHQDYDFESFRALLHRDYPKVAAQFAPQAPSASTTVEPSAQTPVPGLPVKAEKPRCNLQTCMWFEDVTGGQSQAIYIQNKTQRTIRITTLQLYDCVNIKQTCSTTKVNIRLPAHTSRQVLVVDPADPAGAYAYYVRYLYVFDLSAGKHQF
ncbi:MAG: hypothetical protein KGL98_10000 [Gammaproteobacteria bacterium]|nr:hypothetical protein [Gammaproteobacteria bacterium]MBU6510493.1 hypothetical protein [Gammaproteobacteria bacterium]MDE1984349.1 hypothetical protein [Gammaproteobacteria bacterium]MDE2109033.1 hypothetical protein [Gammaproteobacteria bacterium]MDE2461566.1 hypothetical protein [Gammaproteobacteria bacterium]